MTGADDALSFTEGQDKELDMMISFDHMQADCFMTDTISTPFNLKKMKSAFTRWQKKLYGRAGTLFTLKITTTRE